MRRRRFVEAGALSCGAVGLGLGLVVDGLPGRLSFYVAGVRYQDSQFCPEQEQRVMVMPESQGDAEIAFAITSAGHRLGYVPKRLAMVLEGRHIASAYLSSVNRYAAPWKRFEVTLRFA